MQGTCQEIENDTRCETRKRNDTIGLVLTLVAIAVSVGVCAAIKIDQEKRKKMYLEELKIKGNQVAMLEGSHQRAMDQD